MCWRDLFRIVPGILYTIYLGLESKFASSAAKFKTPLPSLIMFPLWPYTLCVALASVQLIYFISVSLTLQDGFNNVATFHKNELYDGKYGDGFAST